MRTPWLDIPLGDYEQHMALPQVGQARLLADQLDELLVAYRPSSVAIIGCAGGNGLDRVAGKGVERVVGVDINPLYVEAAARRYGSSVPGLELYAADIESTDRRFEPVDLIFAALLFEYVDPARVMSALRRHCRPRAVLATLVQLPHESMAVVSPSPYVSLQSLEPAMRLVSPASLRAQAEAAGFVQESTTTRASPAGKQFARQIFRA
jgi:SAM-dependent methyltransferase